MASPFDDAVKPRDPHERYLVEIQALIVGVFKEAQGLDMGRDIHELEEGGRAERVELAGPYSKGRFRLRDGEADDLELFRWFEKSRDADHLASSRRSGAVILVDGTGQERIRWKFRTGVITEWEGPEEPPHPGKPFTIETLGVSHEGLEPILRQ